jgi:hypothetical protein
MTIGGFCRQPPVGASPIAGLGDGAKSPVADTLFDEAL